MKREIIKQETIEGYFISTVWFEGFDMNTSLETAGGPPLSGETMVFKANTGEADDFIPEELYRDRYTSKKDALEGHEYAKRLVLSGKIEQEDDDEE